MATILRRTVKGIPYYYLEHTLRHGSKIVRKSKYLGRTIPKDIDKIKERFVFEINKEKWFGLFDQMREGYSRELKITPKSAKEKGLRTFAIKFTYDTQRIEGSRLTLRETAQLLNEGITPSERPVNDAKEAEAHQRVFFEMLQYKKDLSLRIILYWHKRLFETSKPDIAGQIRKHGVKISGSIFVPPTPVELYPLLKEFFRWYDNNKQNSHPVELAALVHLKLVTVHPFSDGNGRISRLIMNFVLSRQRYPMLDIEYRNRLAYYRALERAQTKRNDQIFCNWFFRQYAREHKSYAM